MPRKPNLIFNYRMAVLAWKDAYDAVYPDPHDMSTWHDPSSPTHDPDLYATLQQAMAKHDALVAELEEAIEAGR